MKLIKFVMMLSVVISMAAQADERPAKNLFEKMAAKARNFQKPDQTALLNEIAENLFRVYSNEVTERLKMLQDVDAKYETQIASLEEDKNHLKNTICALNPGLCEEDVPAGNVE